MNETLVDLKKIVDVTRDKDIKDPGLLRPVIGAINDVLVKTQTSRLKVQTTIKLSLK